MTNHVFSPVKDDPALYASAWTGMGLGLLAFALFSFLWLIQNRPGHKRTVASAFSIASIIIAMEQLAFAFGAGTIVREHGGDMFELAWGKYAARIAAFFAVYVGVASFLNLKKDTLLIGAFLQAVVWGGFLVSLFALTFLQWGMFIIAAIVGAILMAYTLLNSRLQSGADSLISFWGAIISTAYFVGLAFCVVNFALGHGMGRVWGGQPTCILAESWTNVVLEFLFVYVLGVACIALYETNEHSAYTARDRMADEAIIMFKEHNAHRRRKFLLIKDIQSHNLPVGFNDIPYSSYDTNIVYHQHSHVDSRDFSGSRRKKY